MSIFSRRPKSRYDVDVEVTSLSAVPYINGHCYCKLRLLSCGSFEGRTESRPIQNSQILWKQPFQFELKVPDQTSVEEARLRISVRREASGGKGEVKIGYIDLSLARFHGAQAKNVHQGVLQGYEKAKHRTDNSILRVSAKVKNQRPLRTESADSPATPPILEVEKPPVEKPPVDFGTLIKEMDQPMAPSYFSHSRNSSGASGYSSSNNSASEPRGKTDNQALVESLFKDIPTYKK